MCLNWWQARLQALQMHTFAQLSPEDRPVVAKLRRILMAVQNLFRVSKQHILLRLIPSIAVNGMLGG